jgi:hypothetical protein
MCFSKQDKGSLNILCLDDITASGRLKNHLNSPLEPDIARFGGGFDEPVVCRPQLVAWVEPTLHGCNVYFFLLRRLSRHTIQNGNKRAIKLNTKTVKNKTS